MSLLDEALLLMIPSGYKAGKIYSVLPNTGAGDFPFARNSERTRVNSDGYIETLGLDVPAIDYSDGVCPKVLIEDEATQLMTEDVDNAYWGSTNVTIDDNAGVGFSAPYKKADGSIDMGAFKIIEDLDGSDVIHRHHAITSFISGNTYVMSILAKAQDRGIQINNGGAIMGNFNIKDGIINSTGTDGPYFINMINNIKPYVDGWYLISSIFTCTTTTASSFGIFITPTPSYSTLSQPSYQGDGVSGIYVYQPNLVEASHVSSLIPIVSGAEVTRLADQVTPVELTLATDGALVINDYITPISSGDVSIHLESNREKIIVLDTYPTAQEISAMGWTEAVFLTDIRMDGEFSITVSGTGIVYWGDGESEPYDGTDVVLTHTNVKTPTVVAFVGTLTYFQIN